MSVTPVVLVTGAAGFLGSEVMRVFRARGARVIGMGHGQLPAPMQREDSSTSFWSCDINLETLMAHGGAPDIIVHCAGGSSVGASLADPRADFTKSVVSWNDVLTYVRTCCPQARLVYASSAAVYGAGHVGPIDEDVELTPISPYGFHKQICERMATFHARTWGVRAAIVRLFSIYGEGAKRQLLWDACRKFTAGTPRFSGTGNEQRDWVHVCDAAALLCEAASHASVEAPVCNGASGSAVSVRDVVQELGAILGGGVATFDGVIRAGDPAYLVGRSERARSWGWTPKMPWAEGIRRYARWYGENA